MSFFDRRFRFFFGNGGQISPNCDVISSIIDWLSIVFGWTIFSIKNDEWDDGGVKRLTIDIEFDDSFGVGDDDKQGETDCLDINEHVERVLSIISCLIIVGFNETKLFLSSIIDEHEQWPSDVIWLNNVKRIGICIDLDEIVVLKELRRSESFNIRLFES